MFYKSLFSLIFIFLLSACTDKPKMPVEVMATSQGYIISDGNKNVNFVNSDTVKHSPGERVYWYAKVRTNKSVIRYTEEVKMNGPTTWDESKTEIKSSNDKSSATVEREYQNKRGLISGSWKLNKDDPAGKMEINVLIEGVVPLKFVWQVVENVEKK